MAEAKKYLYCVILTREPCVFNISGMEGCDRVYTVNYTDIAMVVSDSYAERFTLSRENLLPHQKVLEEIMLKYTVLPVRFGTQSQSENDIREHVLRPRYKEFRQLLDYFGDKNEMGLKIMWTDISKVYGKIAESNRTIKKMREALAGGGGSRNDLVEIGRLVESELASHKEAERDKVVRALKKYTARIKLKENYGDEMFFNANLLIDKSGQELFDGQLSRLADEYGDSARFKYVGPVPPYDFIQIIV
ncbi:MAG: GvpL/GvpF family gas vesicle protein [Bacillota bacterium]